MKKPTNKPTLIPKMYCSLFGHDYEVTKRVTYHVKEYKCSHCNKELTTNGNGNLIALTPKYREINSILSRIHTKRQSKLNQEELHRAYKMTS